MLSVYDVYLFERERLKYTERGVQARDGEQAKRAGVLRLKVRPGLCYDRTLQALSRHYFGNYGPMPDDVTLQAIRVC